MKVLVLGAKGMAGHMITLKLSQFGYDVTGFARETLPFCQTIVGDIMSTDLAKLCNGFDAVINCIGVLNKEVEVMPHNGIWLNSCLPHLLAKEAKRLIHLSTDCVFSGKKGGYKESSFRSADTMYGRSKALGEIDDNQNLTIRTSIIGPDYNKDGLGLFNWFMKEKGSVYGFTGAIWSGVSTLILAEAVHCALSQKITGIYHLTNNEKISKYELLKLFNKLRVKTTITIEPTDTVSEDKSLICTRDDLDYKVPSYEEMVSDMGKWLFHRKDLYMHYE